MGKNGCHLNKSMKEEKKFIMVSIRCLVYNHEPYLRQCLDGFIKQKTNFNFEAIIHDDASTDGSAVIIREYADRYPDIIKPIFEKENQYSKGGMFINDIMNDACKGKYFALCEGDDYWIDEHKLQKQVDFLETHCEYGLCYTNFNIQNDVLNKKYYSLFSTAPQQYPRTCSNIEDWLLHSYYLAPMTWLVRKELWLDRPIIDSLDGTFVLYASFLHKTKVYCMDDVTAVYRRIPESAASTGSPEKIYKRQKNLHNVRLKLAKMYLTEPQIKEIGRKIDELYYRTTLTTFVVLGKYDEIKEARKILGKGNTMKQKLLLKLPTNNFFTSIMGLLYKLAYHFKVEYERR